MLLCSKTVTAIMTCCSGAGEGTMRKQSTSLSITATEENYKKTTISRLSMQHSVIIGIARQEQNLAKI